VTGPVGRHRHADRARIGLIEYHQTNPTPDLDFYRTVPELLVSPLRVRPRFEPEVRGRNRHGLELESPDFRGTLVWGNAS
jgi:hypothetical protein